MTITIEEVIQILKDIYPSQKQIVTGEYPHVAEGIDLAISALEKQIPISPNVMVRETDIRKYEFYYCENCGLGIAEKGNYCIHCGQKLDWRN